MKSIFMPKPLPAILPKKSIGDRTRAMVSLLPPGIPPERSSPWAKKTGATPDGRRAGDEMSKNLSPSMGMDTNGVTALVKSVTRIDSALLPRRFSAGCDDASDDGAGAGRFGGHADAT